MERRRRGGLPHAILVAWECAADTSGNGLWRTDVAVATGCRGDEHGTVDAEEDAGTAGAGLDVGDGERVVGRGEDRVDGHVEGVLGVGGADECDGNAGLAGRDGPSGRESEATQDGEEGEQGGFDGEHLFFLVSCIFDERM